MLKNKGYIIGSLLLTGFVALNTYLNHEELTLAIAHMTTSKPSLLILFNFFIVFFFLLYEAITKIFFSSLKEAEIQHMESKTFHHGFNLIIVLYMLELDFN